MVVWGDAALIESDKDYSHAPLVRTVVTPESGHGSITAATLTASGLGIFEGYVDGASIGPDVLSPGWSSYQWRIREYAYDVTSQVPDRPFVLGFSLGKGWAGGRLGGQQHGAFWTTKPSLIARLEITYTDGHRQVVVTDADWQSGPSQTTSNDLYDGQSVDARVDIAGWNTDTAPRDGWTGVTVLDFDKSRLVSYSGPRVVRHEDLAPQKIQQAFALLNARLGIAGEGKGWALEAFISNLTKARYIQAAFNAPLQGSEADPLAIRTYDAFLGSPRTYGVTLRLRR